MAQTNDHVLALAEVTTKTASIWLGWGGREPPYDTVVILKSDKTEPKPLEVNAEQGPNAWRKPRDEPDEGGGLVRLVRFDGLTPFARYTVEWRESTDGDVLAREKLETNPDDLPSTWPTVPSLTLPSSRDIWLGD